MGSGYRQLGFFPKQANRVRTGERRLLQQAGLYGFIHTGGRTLRRALFRSGHAGPAPAKVYAFGINRAGNTGRTNRSSRNCPPRLHGAFRFTPTRTGRIAQSLHTADSTVNLPLPKRSFSTFLFLFSPLLSSSPASLNATGELFSHSYLFPLHNPKQLRNSLKGLFSAF